MLKSILRKRVIFSVVGVLIFIISLGSAFALWTLRERIQIFREQKIGTNLSDYPIDTRVEIQVGNTKRFYLLHIPRLYNKQKGSPLVLAFHGGGGSAQNMKVGYDILKKSDKEWFILAFPNGSSPLKSWALATWNAGTCCGWSVRNQTDDVAFVRALIAQIKSEYRVSKIFVMGMSNGAMMSYRLACDAADIIDGVGAVAGTDNTLSCNPKETTPIMHIHAINDDHVLYYWGRGSWSISDNEPEFVSVPATIDKWRRINSCTNVSTQVQTGTGVTCIVYNDCISKSPVKLCTTDSGGHSWPGNGNKATPRSDDKEPPSQAINATDALWSFFKGIQ